MTEALWNLASLVAEIAGPFVEIFGDSICESIAENDTAWDGKYELPSAFRNRGESSGPLTCCDYDAVPSESRHSVNEHLTSDKVIFLF
jgi:hypothetical protein